MIQFNQYTSFKKKIWESIYTCDHYLQVEKRLIFQFSMLSHATVKQFCESSHPNSIGIWEFASASAEGTIVDDLHLVIMFKCDVDSSSECSSIADFQNFISCLDIVNWNNVVNNPSFCEISLNEFQDMVSNLSGSFNITFFINEFNLSRIVCHFRFSFNISFA